MMHGVTQYLQATVCHYNPESTDFWQQVFTWKAPPEENGTVEI